MNTIMKFVNKFGVLIVFVLIVLSTCTNSMNRKMSEKKMLKQVEGVQKSLDSLNKTLQKEIKVEICSACHPFFTGNEKVIDAAGRVERFKARKAAATKLPKKKK